MKAERQKSQRPRFVEEPGYVWCDKLGEIHDDTLNPYQMGVDDMCSHEDHFPVFVRRRGEIVVKR